MNVLVFSNVTGGELKINIAQFIDLTDWLFLLSFIYKPHNLEYFMHLGIKR